MSGKFGEPITPGELIPREWVEHVAINHTMDVTVEMVKKLAVEDLRLREAIAGYRPEKLAELADAVGKLLEHVQPVYRDVSVFRWAKQALAAFRDDDEQDERERPQTR